MTTRPTDLRASGAMIPLQLPGMPRGRKSDKEIEVGRRGARGARRKSAQGHLWRGVPMTKYKRIVIDNPNKQQQFEP